MSAGVISVGDEILSGQVQDTNFPFLARQLGQLGIDVREQLTVGDDRQRLSRAIDRIRRSCDLVLITGGLGPTSDDLTRYSLSDVLSSPLELDEEALGQIEERFRRLKREMAPVNRIQAMMPASARAIENPVGTAPGIAAEINGTHIFALPGVPHEMRKMFAEQIEPELARLGLAGKAIVSTRIHCFGTGESNIFSLIDDLMPRPANPQVGITAHDGVITVSITAQADTPQIGRQMLDETSRSICLRLSEYVFGRDDETLAQVVGRMLIANRQSLVLAESCTGGLIGKMLTDLPGASEFFVADLVTYANSAKTALLSVPDPIIETHGSVSPECAEAMARGAIERTGADWALAVTGIAGPDGGSAQKPVGLVYIGLAEKNQAGKGRLLEVRESRFPGSREHIRTRTALTALDMLRRTLAAREKQK